jgi:hypothetical protein
MWIPFRVSSLGSTAAGDRDENARRGAPSTLADRPLGRADFERDPQAIGGQCVCQAPIPTSRVPDGDDMEPAR